MRLIDKYRPSDYCDSVSKRFMPTEALDADYLFEEIVICKNDKHLGFWVGIYCSQPEDGWQEAAVTTVKSGCR